jgi:Tol biopolymer transport system component
MKTFRTFLGLAFFLSASSIFGQSKHTPSIEEMLNLKYVDSPAIAPDGRFIAYEVQETNWKDNQFIRQLWLVNVATGRSFQLTYGNKSADGASWSPDGQWLAFVTERDPAAIEPSPPTKQEDGGKPAVRQIWLISPEGGEAWQLTKSETDVGVFHWSKDSRYIAFTANTQEQSKPIKDRKEKYGDYEVFEKDYRQNQLWSMDVTEALKNYLPQEAKRLIADLSINVSDFAWSLDSTEIAFTAAANPLLAFMRNQAIYLLELSKNNAVKKIVTLPGPYFRQCFRRTGNS